MTERPRKPPEQPSLDSQFDADGEPSGIDSIPLLQESHEFPEQREAESQDVPESVSENSAEAPAEPAVEPEPTAEPEPAVEPEPGLEPEPLEAPVAEPLGEIAEEAAASAEVEQLAFDDPGFSENDAPSAVDALDDSAGEAWDSGDGWDEEGADEAPESLEETVAPVGVGVHPNRFPSQWIVAGLADLAVNIAVVALAAVATWQLGIPVRVSGWPGYLGFALSFSFLYTAMPLAFWGQTPGMAVSGLRAADGDHQLSFGQTALRWLAAALTLGTLGLPWLLTPSRRPLADRLSRSETLVWHEPED